jgi:hypothetical protein
MTFKNQNLQKYSENGFEQVHGWCDTYLFDTVDLLSSQNINQTGGVAEIGIHHGRLFILLNQVTDANCQSYAIDLFDQQDLNIDKSGGGDEEIFKQNLLTYDAHQGRNTMIIKGDSTDPSLKLTEKISPGSLRFFSIDGGHTPAHVFNDLTIANKLIHNEGIVILDDILNHWWLGVLEGWLSFSKLNPTLVPVAMGHNKLYLCKLSYYKYYLELMNTISLDGPKTIGDFFGHKIVIYRYWKQLPW